MDLPRAEIVKEQGGTITPSGPGSMEHEYWRATLRSRCEEHRCKVTTEYDLGGRYVDLHDKRDDRTLLLEVETGKSTVLENNTKCQGHGTLVVFFTNKNAHDAIRDKLPPDTIALTPETINHLHTILQ